MNSFVKNAINVGTTTTTENGDKTYSTSLNACLDLFFQIGAIRGQGQKRVWDLFSPAYAEDPDLACRIALWARDIRGGAGERESFRLILKYLAEHDTDRLIRLLVVTPEVGRWDDLFSVLENNKAKNFVVSMFRKALDSGDGLAAKWAPREGTAKSAIAKELRIALGLTPKEYRKTVVRLTNVVETPMCEGPKDDFSSWKKIRYENVPSVASARYSKAFGKRDGERYREYLESVAKGETKINTGAVYPYDVIKDSVTDKTADVMWNNLPDYVKDGQGFLPMIDISGSMLSPAGGKGGTTCMDVAISLGIYLAERNKSAFKDLYLTFTGNSHLVSLPKGTIREKVNYVKRKDMGYDTNLDSAFHSILDVAVNGKVPQEDMPQTLIILSDMEFNPSYDGQNVRWDTHQNKYVPIGTSASERAKQYFEEAGYKRPNIVWWNIQSRNGNTPVRHNETGMALVSGFSPSIMTSLLNQDMNPMSQLLATVGVSRYNH